MVLVGLQVARTRSRQRVRQQRQPGEVGRAQDDLPGGGQQAVRELEARVALADDEDAAAGVVGRPLRVDVMGDLLQPRDRGLPRRRHANREHHGPAPVLAFRGGEHKAVVFAARPFPPASVARPDAAVGGEVGEGLRHLRPRGEVGRSLHVLPEGGRRVRGLQEQRVPVVTTCTAGCPGAPARAASST